MHLMNILMSTNSGLIKNTLPRGISGAQNELKMMDFIDGIINGLRMDGSVLSYHFLAGSPLNMRCRAQQNIKMHIERSKIISLVHLQETMSTGVVTQVKPVAQVPTFYMQQEL